MVVAGPECSVAFWALSLPGLVSRPETVVAEAVEALGQHCVLTLHFARRTCQGLLVFPHLFFQNLKQAKEFEFLCLKARDFFLLKSNHNSIYLVHVGVSSHLDLSESLYLPLDQG